MITAWDDWLRHAWPDLISGKRVEVPDWLHPDSYGLQRARDAWVQAFDDGHTLVVAHAAPDSMKLVAEVKKPTRFDAALRTVREWASDHPVAAALLGGVLFLAVVSLVAGIARRGDGERDPERVEPTADGRSSEEVLDATRSAGDGHSQAARTTKQASARQMISAGFAELLAAVQPTEADTRRAEAHANSIEAALSDVFSVNRLLIVGSHSRGTAVRTRSDVDYLAVVARDDVRWGDEFTSSETVLKNVRVALQAKFGSTEIRKDLQAVVVKFGSGEDPVDVVPAVFLGMSPNSRPLYRIPDGNGGWLETSPEGHNKYIREADKRSGGKLRGTAQLLKHWRDCRASAIPMKSFHLELQLAAASVCRVGMTYAECVAATLERLESTECQGVPDPLGISGEVPACSTEAKRVAALEAIRSGLTVVRDALASERAGDHAAARRGWRRFFNREFPE